MSGQTAEFIPGYQIREALPEDLWRALEIAKHAWKRIHDSALEIMGEAMHAVLCANWEDRKAEAVMGQWERHPEWFRVVESEGGGVVAFLTFRVDAERSLGTILNNAVAPEMQGRGIGTAMYRYALNFFREEGMAYASVGTGLDEGHAPARRAYEKAGFTIAQPHVTYYQIL